MIFFETTGLFAIAVVFACIIIWGIEGYNQRSFFDPRYDRHAIEAEMFTDKLMLIATLVSAVVGIICYVVLECFYY